MFQKSGDRLGKIKVTWHEYLLAVGIGLFAVLRILYSLPRFSDGNIYLYLSYLISEGAVPYRDFFYSSPPLIPYVLALWGSMFGFTWQSFSFIPLVLTIVDTVVLYIVAARRFSRLAGLVGALLYLFSFAVLATTDFASDVHVVLTLILLGVLAHELKRPGLAGVLFGAALLAKLYVFVVVAGFAAHYIWERRWVQLAWFGAGFSWCALMLVGLWLVWGSDFYGMLVTSHAGAIAGIDKRRLLGFFIEHDWLLAVAPAAWLSIRARVPSMIVLPVTALLGFYMLFQDVYYLYFKILAAWLALWLAWNVREMEMQAARRWLLPGVLTVAVVTAGVSVWRYVKEQSRAAVISPLEEVSDYVASVTGEADSIYGSFEVTPIIALSAERTIWRNYVDTNSKFFDTGWFDIDERAGEAIADQVPVVITKAVVTPGGSIVTGSEQVLPSDFFTTYCRASRVFPVERDYTHNAVVVWKCAY